MKHKMLMLKFNLTGKISIVLADIQNCQFLKQPNAYFKKPTALLLGKNV